MNEAAPSPTTDEVREHQTRWWKEALIMGTFYFVYSLTRNNFGSVNVKGADIPLQAFHNAEKIIRVERALGLFHEESIQQWFLPYKGLIQALNTYYGTAHFAVTIAVFFILFRRRKDVFPIFRNALACMTALAIVGFSFFPLMPPRLLDAPCPSVSQPDQYGGACIESKLRNYNGAENFGFVDTLDEYGGPWDFNSGGIAKASNQYAAMPSLHIGWASWCAFGIWPLARRRWIRAAVLLYPALTLFTIVVTANHYWFDGIGGLIALLLGFIVGNTVHNWNQQRLDAQFEEARSHHPSQSATN
jgi:hypothetical protein